MYYLYAGFNHKYGDEVALVGAFGAYSEAQQLKDLEELAWSDEGLKFQIRATEIDPPPNISYNKLQVMVMK